MPREGIPSDQENNAKFPQTHHYHIPKMKCALCKRREYDASLYVLGSLTLRVSPEVIILWAMLPLATRCGKGF